MAHEKDKDSQLQRIWKRSLGEIMSDSFAKYAKYIIQDRALPDIRDGLKPVQRRILYGMSRLNLTPDRPHKKSASTVGEVIGKYHPHGDSSIYEALVRMSQPWKNNIRLIDMQGNNGSIDGDSPAAMRYTEARLSPFAYEMLANLEKETVKFVPNFDDAETEPTVLPSLLPNLMVNGASGIAAGYATNIPPYNLNELIDAIIMRIDSPNCRLDSLMKVIPAPDFPTGGIIHDDGGIKEAFETGRGKLVIRAKIGPENDKRKNKLIISEIPFETNKALIIRSIEEIIVDNKLPYLEEVRDESDKNGIRIVLEYKGDEKAAEAIKKYLYKTTQLQINFNINTIVIDHRKPVQMGLIGYLDSYLSHAVDVIIKSTNFDLKKAKHRLEIVVGLIKATSVIDQVVKLIRSANDKNDAKEKLIAALKLSEIQAEAIVQLRLYRLTNTDVQALMNESKELQAQIEELQALLDDEVHRNNYLKNILRNYKKRFGNARKSQVAGAVEKIVIEATDVIENKTNTLVVTRDGYLKLCSPKTVSIEAIKTAKLKEGDSVINIQSADSLDRLLLITIYGNFLVLPVHKIKPSRLKEQGAHINSITTLRDNEKIIYSQIIKANQNETNETLFLTSKDGMVKRIFVNDIMSFKSTRPSVCMSLKANDLLVDVQNVHDEKNEVLLISKNGYGLRFNIDEVTAIGLKGMGVRGIKLRPDDNLISSVIVSDKNEYLTLLASHGNAKRVRIHDIDSLSRSTMGKPLLQQVKSKPYKITYGFIAKVNQPVLIADNEGNLNFVKVGIIPVMDLDSRMSAVFKQQVYAPLIVDETIINETNNLFNNAETPS
ncbi:DNA topoisomerase IV subunit A [[Mycoplasma] testudinis]|uniref:DNA topoisomerase IV subunit A n=1 Tax=[Mycoplasma] testudinis TaxID=33924 RepID=UPI000487CFDD|nr:DNA topoisomerase IV subunit A [[Mycoplasma] testudinis]